VEHVGDAREGVQVTLGSAEVNEHVRPSLGNGRATMPTEKFLLEDGNLGEDEIGKIHHLLSRDKGAASLGEVAEFSNSLEDSVDRHR
jgi:hypothetical protein